MHAAAAGHLQRIILGVLLAGLLFCATAWADPLVVRYPNINGMGENGLG